MVKSIYEIGDWVHIKKYPKGHINEIGRVGRILKDGRVFVSNFNMPFQGTISGYFKPEELEIESHRRTK